MFSGDGSGCEEDSETGKGLRRRFSQSEKAVLFLASGGKCSLCGVALGSGWHGDHMFPWSAGGRTDVVNGQALCRECNLVKGCSVGSFVPRAWQVDAMNVFRSKKEPQDFLVSATPGAGKTQFAAWVASDLIERGLIDRVMVVVSTDSLRQQWADKISQMGIEIKPVSCVEDYSHPGYVGASMTYAQLDGVGKGLARKAIADAKTLVIMDEIHHAGDNKAWGDGLKQAAEFAKYRLALTGTPWRSDPKSPIPFVTYGPDNKVVVDYAYEYGQAVADEVCRRVVVDCYDCESVRWVDFGKISEASLGDDLSDDDVSAVLETVYHPTNQWINALLAEADEALSRIRMEGPKDAAGLVVASTQEKARAYGYLLKAITGEDPVVVVSDDGAQAREAISAFEHGSKRWIVSVNMVSEGVDIPRLAVGVYASKYQTPLFFRQVIGRIVRRREGEEFNAQLFVPAVPKLKEFARDVENELRHQLELEMQKVEKQDAQAELDQRQFNFREPLSASDAVFDASITGGVELSQADIDAAAAELKRVGIPTMYAPNFAMSLRRGREVTVTVSPKPNPAPRHRQELLLRQDLKKLTNTTDRILRREPGWTNTQIRKAGFPPRDSATLKDMEKIRDFVMELRAVQ